jgi:hypothetical protein
MYHYFGNSGTLLKIDYRSLLQSVASANTVWVNNKVFAKDFCQSLPFGNHDIVSKESTAVYCSKDQSRNWFYAVGGFHCWGKGTVTIEGAPGQRRYRLWFTWLFSDRYNWDTGKVVDIAGIVITDKFMGDFHRQGMAQEFNMDGGVTEAIEWSGP